MRQDTLELATFPTHELEFGARTAWRGGKLAVNRAELAALLADDDRLAGVDLHIARPGEPVRIVHILDIIEPRAKADGSPRYFPGALEPLYMAGLGRTHVVSGVAVVVSGDVFGSEECILDMDGPGAAITRFGQTLNLVVVPTAAPDVRPADFARAALEAGLKAAVYLAAVTQDQEPTEVESFTFGRPAPPDVPRLAYLYYLYSHGPGRQRLFYGHPTTGISPTIVHPNAILDGAIVNEGYTIPSKSVTWNHQNNGAIRALYARDGKDLSFAGTILINHNRSYFEKDRSAMLAASLARDTLGANGVIIAKDGGGQADVDIMRCCEWCEQAGLKTVLLVIEQAQQEGDDCGLADVSDKAVGIVTIKNQTEPIVLPGVRTVIGGQRLYDGKDPQGPLTLLWNVVGEVDFTGGVKTTTIEI